MDSVETVIRFRQSPPEGDIMSVTISIVLDVSTGYIMKNGSGWWCTSVWGEDRTHFLNQWKIACDRMRGVQCKNKGRGDDSNCTLLHVYA